MTIPAFDHPAYQQKFPDPEAQILPFTGTNEAQARSLSEWINAAYVAQAAVLDAQKRFAKLAELIEEQGLNLGPEDPRKQILAALAMDADNGRRAMEEARGQ